MKLCNLVEIEDNNLECVILKVKDNAKLDLIKLGCFDGDEEYLRLTKGEDHTCTIFKKDGSHFDWHWGRSGCSLVSDKTTKTGKMIEECITEDFDIYIGDKLENIKACLNIKSLDDVKNAQHFIKFMYWDKKDDNICTHKDNSYYKHFKNLNEAKNHFENLGYKLEKNNQYIASTGCVVEEYFIEKKKELDFEMITKLDDLDEEHSYTIARIIDDDKCVELHSDRGLMTVEYGTKINEREWDNVVEGAQWFNKSMSEEEIFNHLEKLLQEFKEEDNGIYI